MDVDPEGRQRRAVYLPPECWAWLEQTAARDGTSRSDLLEGLVLLAMDDAEDRAHTQQERENWQAGVDGAVCFIDACDYTDIDARGPVFVRGDRRPRYACTEHWEAIVGILGRQAGSDDEMRHTR